MTAAGLKRYVRAAAAWFFGAPLFLKVAGIALLVTALFSIGVAMATRSVVMASLKEDAGRRARLLSRQIESDLLDRLITRDLVGISAALRSVMGIYPDIKYIFIRDRNGNLLVNTLPFSPSRVLQGANAPGPAGELGEVLLQVDGEVLNDVAVPLMGGRLGTLRMGVSQSPIRREVSGILLRLQPAMLLAAIVGMLIVFPLTYAVVKPVRDLIKGVESVEKGDFGVRVRPWFDDEVGRLTAAFNNMAGSLEKKTALKKELLRRLITSQEAERQRISRELHDRTNQSLASVKVLLKVLEMQALSGKAVAGLAELKELLNSSMEEIHEFAVELRPPLLGEFGLPRAVEELGRKLGRSSGVKLQFDIGNGFGGRRLEPAVEIELYRIIQEAFSNIEKHSGATEARVSFRGERGELGITVTDNGRGFEPGLAGAAAGRAPLGLFGMKERAEALGGSLRIVSARGRGTEITVVVPESWPESVSRQGQ